MRIRIRSAVACFLPVFFALGMPLGHAQTSPELLRFDEEAAQCRRVVREYCAIVQEMMKVPQVNETQRDQGLTLLRNAREQWNVIAQKWGSNPPSEYASDASFKARLQDFSDALEDMENTLAAGHPRRSFMACGYGCGLFVTMHEQNGLAYALDALYHLRKTAKTMAAAVKSGGVEKAREMAPALMEQRNRVFLSPAPWPETDARSKPYSESIRDLSQKIDELAVSVAAADSNRISAILKELLESLNRSYTLAL